MFDHTLQEALHKATQYTTKLKNEYVSLEHFLWGALHVAEVISFLEDNDVNHKLYISELESFVLKNHAALVRVDSNYNPEPTIGLHRCIDRALQQAQSSGKNTITCLHILLSMFEEDESQALYLLEDMGLSPLIIMEQLSSQQQDTGAEPGKASKDPLKKFCENLNKKFNEGLTSKLIGRKSELQRTLEILSRKNKNNPLLVGDPGVGKTALGEGLAELVETGLAPERFKDLSIFSLDLTSLLAGAKYRGDFEGRLKSLFKSLKEIKNPLLFIDEVHTIVGAGSTSGSNVDLAGLLKPVLTDPHVKVVGSTTYAEYRKFFAKDPALSRRFQPIFIEEPSKKESLEILKGAKDSYEKFHNLKISAQALQTAVDLSEKHILDRKFPDKALDLLDEACAHESVINNAKTVGPDEILKCLSRVYKVSEKAAKSDSEDGSNSTVSSLQKELTKYIYGQNTAIDELNSNILVAYSGLNDKNKPLGSFLFTGPTGVGKTELSKQLAKHLNIPLVKFDMSEYMEKHSVSRLIGAPPGYVGHDEGGRLTDEVSKSPHCVLLLDEVEKAHPDVINILLQVMDSAILTDSIGKQTHFNQCILIMTSNSGARSAEKGSVGIYEAPTHDFSDKAIKEFFSPEFINRLTAIIKFNSLEDSEILKVITKSLNLLKTDLKEKSIDLTWTDDVTKWILTAGAEKGMGARPYERFVSKHIKVPVAKKLITRKDNKAFAIKLEITSGKLTLS